MKKKCRKLGRKKEKKRNGVEILRKNEGKKKERTIRKETKNKERILRKEEKMMEQKQRKHIRKNEC